MAEAKNREAKGTSNLIRNILLLTICHAIAFVIIIAEGLLRIALGLMRRAMSPILAIVDTYRISRANAGYVMIGGSILLFLIAGSMDDPQMSITEAAVLGNLISIAALALIGPGIYLWYFSKRCPVCHKQLSRTMRTCHYCRDQFTTPLPVSHWSGCIDFRQRFL
ncbi:MAG: hypothetical protein ACTHLX_03270 [Candidatus Binatia bacterium]